VLQAPQLLTAEHVLGEFDSGVPSLDDWLRRRAMLNQAKGASRTYVLSDAGRVVAFYALAASAVGSGAAPGRFKRNMPDPIPVVVLGRLAIARSYQRRGLGRALFQDAAQRVVHASDAIGIRGLLVHAISDEAKSFYLSLGLTPSPIEPMTLMATIGDLRGTTA
jgi:GNAT superfamily N-acetyltransferase